MQHATFFQFVFAAILASLLITACKPPCNAPAYVDLVMADQRDVVRCPEQRLQSSPSELEAVRQCLRDAIAVRRPFIAPINVGVPGRGTGAAFVVGRLKGSELELFALVEENPGTPGARVIGHRCEGFSQLMCSPYAGGTSCSANCSTLVGQAPTPPFPEPPANPGAVWCGAPL